MPISDAALAFAQKRNVPTELVSEDFETWDSWIRERAFFMAGVEDARILQAYRTEIEKIVRGESSGTESFNRLHLFLERIGYPIKDASGSDAGIIAAIDGWQLVICSGGRWNALNFGIYPTKRGTAAPATAPEVSGQMYVDTINNKVYVSTGISSVADWTALN